MTLFVFDVREVLSRRVMVKAETMGEAWDEVERMYMDSEIVLDPDRDFGARPEGTQALSTAQRDVR